MLLNDFFSVDKNAISVNLDEVHSLPELRSSVKYPGFYL